MIKLIKPDPPPPRYRDPDEPLAGKCMTCGTIVSCTLQDTQLPRGQFAEKKDYIGAWVDLVSAECPKCGARTFVMPAKDAEPLITKKAQ